MNIRELKYWIPPVSWIVFVKDAIELYRKKQLGIVTDEDCLTHIDNNRKLVLGLLVTMLIIVIVILVK